MSCPALSSHQTETLRETRHSRTEIGIRLPVRPAETCTGYHHARRRAVLPVVPRANLGRRLCRTVPVTRGRSVPRTPR